MRMCGALRSDRSATSQHGTATVTGAVGSQRQAPQAARAPTELKVWSLPTLEIPSVKVGTSLAPTAAVYSKSAEVRGIFNVS